jgi:hypothetical protein
VPSPPGFWESISCLIGLQQQWTSTHPRKPLPPPGCLTLVLYPQWHYSLGLSFAVLDTPWPLPSPVRSPRPQEDLGCL